MISQELITLLETNLGGKKLTFQLNEPPPSSKGLAMEDKVKNWGINGKGTGPKFYIQGESYWWDELASDITVETTTDTIRLIGVQQPTDVTIHL